MAGVAGAPTLSPITRFSISDGTSRATMHAAPAPRSSTAIPCSSASACGAAR